MKKKRGFTLIELLAVIVILAIIALIATPIILNMINEARRSAAKSSSLGFVDSIEYFAGFSETSQSGTGIELSGYNVSLPAMTNDEVTCSKGTSGWDNTCKTFMQAVEGKNKGQSPTKAIVKLNKNGKVQNGSKFLYNNYTCTYSGKDIEECTKGDSIDSSNNNQQQVTYKCKKATTLSNDGTHTFGTNTGSTLVPGMALDCKVSTTGDYDHRFYYVTDLKTNNNYAVLIYNNNTKVTNGTLTDDNTISVKYSTENLNYNGPQATIMDNLPTTTHWNNVGLASSTRSLESVTYSNGHVYSTTTHNGDYELPTNFSYAGKAARLITYEEVVTACDLNNSVTNPTYQNYLNNCAYLMENTNYSNSSNKDGYWLETAYSTSDTGIWILDGSSRHNLYSYSVIIGDYFGVRPVIEVKKTDINLN